MTDPRIVFCITCKGRTQHLRQTLPRNLADNLDYPNARFVVLNYGSQDDLMEYLRDNHKEAIEDNYLSVYTFPDAGPFRMAHAKNMAHRLGIVEGGEILVNLDADNFTGWGFARWIGDQFARDPDCFLAIGKITPGITPRGLSGRIVVSRQAFLNAGGYDEKYDDWGPDDKDFNWRLRRMGYRWIEIPERFLDCVRHNDKMRFREYPHARTCADSGALLPTCEHTVCNWGDFGCGVVIRYRYGWDVFGGDCLEVAPVPTRIFGIGMHKTGTTSLHHALNILGCDSAHWPSAHWAKKIWREMNTAGRSPTVESHYSLCDLPISNLFRKLDLAYPGSKFILTIRSERSWIESVRRHWQPDTNPFRELWDTDPFTHIIHNATYGRTDFHEATFLRAYRQHNNRVLNHFRERPNDLLVLDMVMDSDRQSWKRLCSFLNRRLPPAVIPFPRMNQTA